MYSLFCILAVQLKAHIFECGPKLPKQQKRNIETYLRDMFFFIIVMQYEYWNSGFRASRLKLYLLSAT